MNSPNQHKTPIENLVVFVCQFFVVVGGVERMVALRAHGKTYELKDQLKCWGLFFNKAEDIERVLLDEMDLDWRQLEFDNIRRRPRSVGPHQINALTAGLPVDPNEHGLPTLTPQLHFEYHERSSR